MEVDPRSFISHTEKKSGILPCGESQDGGSPSSLMQQGD